MNDYKHKSRQGARGTLGVPISQTDEPASQSQEFESPDKTSHTARSQEGAQDTLQSPELTIDREAASRNVVKLAQAVSFRPSLRPPMARLIVHDDVGAEGECLRIRADKFVIGRATGDLVIAHDGMMSSTHAEIRREKVGEGWLWMLRDLGSTNGTFVRITEVQLEHGQEIMLGSSLFVFELCGASDSPASLEMNGTEGRKQTLQADSNFKQGQNSVAKLTPINRGLNVAPLHLSKKEHWLGRDGDVCDLIVNDPMIAFQEAKLFLNDSNEWAIRKTKSINGVWVRIQNVPIEGAGIQFQCGEQRFTIRLD